MKVVELFAGVGGFRIGLERNGHEVVWANEWDKYAADIYDKNFGGKINRESITDVPAEDIPEHDLICGGFPCQAFSIAGKRKGFDETRGTLFFDIMRIARHHRAPYLFLENVKGLLNHDGGRTFETIIRTLDELGYDCQWQVLNSKDFGVPQNRERVFIIGHFRGEPRPEVFPIESTDSDAPISQLNGAVHQDYRFYDPDGISPTLASNRGGGSAAHPMIATHYGHKDKPAEVHGISPTLKAQSHGHKPMVVDYKNPNSETRRGRVKEGYTGALETTPQIAVDGIRRLTPMECERLQGFPDGWTEGVSDTQRYKMMGNAVTVNVIEAVAQRIYQNHNLVA